MRTKLLALVLFAASCACAQPRYYASGYVAYPAPPPPVVVGYAPPCPGPGYVWIGGYYYPDGERYQWRGGYWTRPPHPRAYWVAPRYHHGHYYYGYWHR